ncbi:SET domain-containing protein [Bermanella marisrubri]|uniref:Nuclear protein SET n=2 Tax=Bermanella marisrubri TaxID=207949 RepID=Q1N5D5_9GAMM|nr:SET domain-containing protein [Bermanella marisrubri]EAT13167.1 Nuclear protein SET [Oceanobacter sp. RED65] [Bermanella marisrubri]QIZ85788.1 SET domain-containing protein [Bermanella marisrubri]
MSSDKLNELVEVKESPVHGKGLFAKVNIKKDCLIGRIEGKEVTRDGPHVLWMEDGEKKFKVSNDLKFINHNKHANVAYYDDYTVMSIRSIKKGEELLHDYGEDWD